MIEPAYKPEQWVIYRFQDGTGGFGRITGGVFVSAEWNYSISGPDLDATYTSALQSEITHYYENGSWLEPQSTGVGRASVYTEQN